MKILILACLLCGLVRAQENAQTRIPRSLEECYRNRTLYERDNRLPSTIPTLIRLIRKIEEYPSLNMDIKDLAITLVHRFKQDGIEMTRGILNTDMVLPYSPSGYQFAKHKLLLTRLLPSNPQTSQRFPNETLTMHEQCSLHWMLSTSIDSHVRGDEAFRCSQLAQYRTNRVPRETGDVDLGVEILKKPMNPKASSLVEKLDNEYDTELDDDTVPPRNMYDFGFETNNNAVSQCPVENGVVQSRWGAISAGTLLAGIAAGLEYQAVRVLDVIPRRLQPSEMRRMNGRQSAALVVDNRWAATLSGDLAELALLQGPRPGDLQVGAKGAWNNTILPHWYFLSQKDRHEITDAEIRGGLDGLIIAKKIVDWRNSFGQLKLSQVLDMYYSERGVFNGDEKACKRKDLFEQVAPLPEMQAQAESFTTVLDRELTFGATLDEKAMQQFSKEASEALSRYVPQYLNELSCDATMKTPGDGAQLEASTDIYIFVDTTWPYQDIQPVVADILENLDFGITPSTYTLFDAQEARILVENTTDLSHLYGNWTYEEHQKHQTGLNLPNVIKELRFRGSDQLDSERQYPTLGGKSKLALIITQLASVSDGERNHVVQNLEYMRDDTPDLRLLFFAAGSVSRFSPFVRDERRDLFTLTVSTESSGSSVKASTGPVIQRIKEQPRRIINYRCGSKWDNWDNGANNMVQYVSPGGVNYYRLAPNYFFRKQDNRKLKIQGSGYASISVCHSRQIEFPRQNSSSNQDGEKWCKMVNMDTVEIDLYHACSGYGYIRDCPPMYVSVEYPVSGPTTNFRCIDKLCRNPDDARFVIHTENLQCYSSATTVVGSLIVLIFAVFSSLRLF